MQFSYKPDAPQMHVHVEEADIKDVHRNTRMTQFSMRSKQLSPFANFSDLEVRDKRRRRKMKPCTRLVLPRSVYEACNSPCLHSGTLLPL